MTPTATVTAAAATTTTTTFNGLFSRTAWVSQHQIGKTSLDLNEARDDGVLGCSGISWTICKQSAPRSRQITTPPPHHSIFTVFTGQMYFLMPKQQYQITKSSYLHSDRCKSNKSYYVTKKKKI